MKDKLWRLICRSSFYLNKHRSPFSLFFGVICFALFVFSFVSGQSHRSSNFFDSVAMASGLLLLPFGVAFGIFYVIGGVNSWIGKRLDRESSRSHRKERPENEKIRDGGEGSYELARSGRSRLHDEDHWSAEDDKELKRRMDEWRENH